MRLLVCGVLAVIVTTGQAYAQAPETRPTRMVLAVGKLASVIETPLHFRLLSIEVTPGSAARYAGPTALLYAMTGTLGVTIGGAEQPVHEGEAVLLEAGKTAALRAMTAGPARALQFILAPASDPASSPVAGAEVRELYRNSSPIPDLRSGPYELSLTRVTFPGSMPSNPIHYRSGAALYYLLSGEGVVTADGKSETKRAGMPHFEPYGWVHQWANPIPEPLVLLQANISPEGAPAVLFGRPPP
jgi:quercetin dioxygenase-like cupin family protein